MMRLSAGLRLYGIPDCPTISMSATLTNSEIRDVIRALGLRSEPVLLVANPIQSHIKFSMIRRPSSNFGLEGTDKKDGGRNPGLIDLLNRVYLDQYVADLLAGRKPKTAIIFCRGNSMLGDIYGHLMYATEYKYKDCRDAPFVMNHASLLPPTEKVISERLSEISLYLSTNKMLMGINLPQVDFVIFVRPFNQLAALVQGGGRGGRKRLDGMRNRVQVYQFYNSQDFTSKNKQMSPDMRRICESTQCTRRLLQDFFASSSNTIREEMDLSTFSCCHNCDLKSLDG